MKSGRCRIPGEKGEAPLALLQISTVLFKFVGYVSEISNLVTDLFGFDGLKILDGGEDSRTDCVRRTEQCVPSHAAIVKVDRRNDEHVLVDTDSLLS